MNHVLCDGGLCNRLNALIFALILKRRFGGEWSISWPRNNWCGAAFGQLFIIPMPVDELTIEDYKARENRSLLLMHENQIGFATERLIINKTLTSYGQYGHLLSGARRDGLSVVYFNSLLPPFVSDDDIRDALSLLRPSPEVATVAARFVAKHGINAGTVGLHIRKTDFGDAVDDQALFAQVQGHPRRFFVCSDDAAVNRRFAALPNCSVFDKSAFPEKLEGTAGWQHWTTDAEGRQFPFNIKRGDVSVIEGLVDLLILSRTEIVVTSGSTFLSTARMFGRCGFFTPDVQVRAAEPAQLVQESPMNQAVPEVVDSPAPAATSRPVVPTELFALLNLIRPWQMISDFKVRIGSNGDGGYVMPSSSLRSNTVVSIGIGNEVSFDNQLAEAGARVLQFDHTIEVPPSTRPGIEFHRMGWGSRDEYPLVSLASIVRMIDWQRATHSILKFDTEGAEWDCLAAADSTDLDRFEVLTGEFHSFDQLVNREYFDRAMAVFQKLVKTHRVIHMHANNAGGLVMVGGIPFPRLLELTFMRTRSASFHGHSSEPIPGPLDRPNVSQLPDLHLRAF